MELFLLAMLFCVVLFVSLFLTLISFKTQETAVSAAKLPPGKRGWPIIGESLEFYQNGRKGTPHNFIQHRMQKYSSRVFKTSLLTESIAVFCGASGNKFMFSNENKLLTHWWPRSVDKIFPSSLQTSSKEEAVKMRKLLPGFLIKPQALQSYIAVMDSIAKSHLATAWENNKEVTVFPLAKNYIFTLACRLFLSIDDPEHIAKFADRFGGLASGIISIPIDLPGTAFNRAVKASNSIRKELIAIIKKRKMDLAEKKTSSAMEDILSHMLLASDENGQLMKEMEIADKILGLLIGGHDTASSAITFILKFLAELPHVYSEILKEQTEIAKSKGEGELLNWEDIQKMKYSWNVAREVMRLTPPLQGGFREAITDFTYEGFSIPKGWKLYWTPNSTHRNPDYFPEPEKFDPTRFDGNGPAPYTFVPFGGGPRMCPGKEYARLEILVFLHNVVRMFKWEKLLPDEKIIVDLTPTPAKGLPIRLHPHQN